MELLKLSVIAFLCVYSLVFLYLLIKTRKPIKFLFINALLSLWLFAVLELTGFLTSFHIPLNPFTFGTAVIGGMPATLMLLIFRSIIF